MPIQRGAKVVRVDVEPAIIAVAVGKQVCLSALQVRAFGPDGSALAGAPLSSTIREDHKAAAAAHASEGRHLHAPREPGEYPIRFTSKLPAPD